MLLTAAIPVYFVPVTYVEFLVSIRKLIDILRPISHNPEKRDQCRLLHLSAPFPEVPLPVPPISHINVVLNSFNL